MIDLVSDDDDDNDNDNQDEENDSGKDKTQLSQNQRASDDDCLAVSSSNPPIASDACAPVASTAAAVPIEIRHGKSASTTASSAPTSDDASVPVPVHAKERSNEEVRAMRTVRFSESDSSSSDGASS